MAKIRGAIVVEIERCKGCQVCVNSCPSQVISMSQSVNGKGFQYAIMANPDECTGCSNCAIVCPDAVITVYRTKVEAEI
jgi:2-oxoglutarate ferredoxin oxidoreductase subunit delta